MMLSGCGSKARTKTYKLPASYATFASVGSFGAPPSLGRHSWNSVMGGAWRHTASSSRPSMTGGCAACVAVTLLAGARAVESARRCGEASGDWVASVTAARSGNPTNMNSPVVSLLDDETLKKVVSGCHRLNPFQALSSPGRGVLRLALLARRYDEMHRVCGERDERHVLRIAQHRDDSVRSRRHAVPLKLGLRAAQVNDAGDARRNWSIERAGVHVEEEMVMRCARPLLGCGRQHDTAHRKPDVHR